MDKFTEAYLEIALWTTIGDDCHPLDDDYTIADFAPEAVVNAAADCARFQATNVLHKYNDSSKYSDEEIAGHDFWLTRNHHGVGFWSRGLGEEGERLTRAAHTYGPVYAYVGDDGKIYFN